MWIVTRTPSNYRSNPEAIKEWCIMDVSDGDIHNFYDTFEMAVDHYQACFKFNWFDLCVTPEVFDLCRLDVKLQALCKMAIRMMSTKLNDYLMILWYVPSTNKYAEVWVDYSRIRAGKIHNDSHIVCVRYLPSNDDLDKYLVEVNFKLPYSHE